MPEPTRHARDRVPSIPIVRAPGAGPIVRALGAGLLSLALLAGLACQPAENANADAPAGETVQVSLMEFEIDMPATLPAGETVFAVTNDGTMRHNFEVEGQGIEREFERDLEPGESDTLRVELEPGTYHVYCPVEDHEERGMSMELRVRPEEA